MPRTFASLALASLWCCPVLFCTGDCALAAPAPAKAAPPAAADAPPPKKPAPAAPKAAAEQASPPAGHSLHGEAFDQGPRQAAYLMGGTGKVSFAISSRVPKVQEFFNQGVGQLHGFWYFEAERSFRQASALDPASPMPYWGMAMANVNTAKRARGFIAEAVKRKAAASPRERLWIEALDEYYHPPKGQEADDKVRRQYVRRLENIVQEFNDPEAKAFLIGKIWENSSHGITIGSHEAVDALIREVLAANPEHPVHHYRIHLWDNEKPARALESAAKCGPAAPAIAHMWHMPGHTYSKLNRYADAAWQQEASSRVDHAYMMHDFVLPDQIHNYAHNEEWLIRNLVFLGRARQAIDLARCLLELPRHPRYNQLTGSGSASYGRTRLLEVLERYELWADAIQLSDAGYLEPLEDRAADARRVQLLGAAYFYTGDRKHGREQIAKLEAAIAAVKKMAAAKEAEKKTADGDKQPKKTEKTAGSGSRSGSGKARAKKLKTLEQALACLRGHEALAAGDAKAATTLFEQGESKDKELMSRAYLAAGNRAKAEELARAAFESGKNQFYPLANYVDMLWRSDRKAEAGKQFEQLRTLAWQADLDLPICARLQPVAAERGIAGSWRVTPPTPEDIGQRPLLAKLGPFRWQPPMAPAWQAKDASGKLVSSTQFRGQPVLVVFYLGFGCIHCVEQLKAFSPLADKFKQAGIQIVAIGTDKVQDLADSTAASKAGAKDKPVSQLAFPLLSDAGLEMFHRFRAYDDFEKQPLHGVFLIDAGGRLRWQDISYEPFTDAEFVLKESQRLLSRGFAQAADGQSPNRDGK
ncbi:MAG TPA: peroxiredoxin family protein [Pirellulales bacterium]|nr:peroxiredoxin family protein [Pirellulales bacterium]